MITITRSLEIDSGHRVLNHESKCAHPHGHRYRIEITCSASRLDSIGRVIDFSAIKQLVGAWLDENMDHAFLLHPEDPYVEIFNQNEVKIYVMPSDLGNPTAENMAIHITKIAIDLLSPKGIEVERVRVYETPNCWADWERKWIHI